MGGNPKGRGEDALDAAEELIDRPENLHRRWLEAPLQEDAFLERGFRKLHGRLLLGRRRRVLSHGRLWWLLRLLPRLLWIGRRVAEGRRPIRCLLAVALRRGPRGNTKRSTRRLLLLPLLVVLEMGLLGRILWLVPRLGILRTGVVWVLQIGHRGNGIRGLGTLLVVLVQRDRRRHGRMPRLVLARGRGDGSSRTTERASGSWLLLLVGRPSVWLLFSAFLGFLLHQPLPRFLGDSLPTSSGSSSSSF